MIIVRRMVENTGRRILERLNRSPHASNQGVPAIRLGLSIVNAIVDLHRGGPRGKQNGRWQHLYHLAADIQSEPQLDP
jgi:hypothetical protein